MSRLSKYFDTKTLNPLAQLMFERLLEGKISDKSLMNRRAKAKKSGDIKEFFDIGMALYLYNESKKIDDIISK